jgi:hypothetical protein
MRPAFVAALLMGTTSAAAPKSTLTDAVKFTEGFLLGALDAEGFTDIEKCIKDAELLYVDAKIAVADFEKKDLKDIISGFKDVAQMIGVIKAGMTDCGHLKEDAEKLEKMVSIYSTLPSFAWHVGKDLIVNRRDIYNEISSAITDYKGGNWENFGKDIGEASAKVFLGAKELEKENRAQRVKSLFEGFSKVNNFKFNLLDLLECIYEEDQAAIALDIGVQQFE